MSPGKQELIELFEYRPKIIPSSAISEDIGKVIFHQYKNQIDIDFPTPKTDEKWWLKSRGWVGFIPLTPELGLYLSPKIPLQNLFGMLEYAYRLESLKFMKGLATCSSLEEFYDQLAKLLANRVLLRGRKGFYRSYDPKNEPLPYVCGRLDVLKALRCPWQVNLECHYEEFTSDIEDNQILAWTLHRILLTGMCSENSLPIIRLAYRTVQGFSSLKPFAPSICLKRLYNRLNQDYAGMHALCRFFLENSGPKHEIGDRTMIPFLVDMNHLFELFVAEWLKAHLPPQYSLKSQEEVSLDEKGTINFKIDLVLYDEVSGTPLCVLDTKYKASDSPKSDDFSQVALYALAKRCSLALLIYPTPLTTPIDIPIRDIRVKSLIFDLNGDLEHSGDNFLQELLALQPEILQANDPPGETGQGIGPIPDGRIWNENTFFHELESKRGSIESDVARKILEWAKDKLPRFWWGNGKIDGSFFPILDYKGIEYYPIGIWTYGKVEIQFQRLKTRSPFDKESKRKELLDRLNLIPGVSIPEDAITRRPNIPLAVFKKKAVLGQLFDVLTWVIQEIRTN